MSGIPFASSAEEEIAGAAGYLKFIRAPGNNWLGALFLIDGRGGPVEFTYARMHAPSSFLWRADDIRVHCQRILCAAVFDICPTSPLAIFCEAEEVASVLFSEHILVQLPVGLVTSRESAEEDVSKAEDSLHWIATPEAGSPAMNLSDAISVRGLLTEPFSRAEVGLCEVYADLFAS